MASYDPYYNDVKLLLLGNGTNDSQTITDEKGHTITVNGNTCIKTATKKFGTGSIYFDGNGDYLSLASTDLNIGTGDFTADMWVYLDGAQENGAPFIGNWDGGTGWMFYLQSGYLRAVIGSTFSTASTSLVPTDQWVHIAISRESGVVRTYIGQDKVSQDTIAGTIDHTTNTLVGFRGDTFGYYFKGYMDDVRFTNYARYTTGTIRVPAFQAGITNVPPAINISAIAPATVPTSGGTPVTVTGSGFSDYTTCAIDGTSLDLIALVSDTSLTGETPAKTVGFKDVVVGNP